MSDTPLQLTPLNAQHKTLGARMVPFGGWEMPLHYTGVLAEHRAVRSGAGVFDISHMGKFVLRGPAVRAELDRLIPSSVADVSVGRGRYSVLLNEAGGIIDDVIVYCEGADPERPEWERWTAIVNAATTAKDLAWLQAQFTDVECLNLSGDRLLLAIQGPQAQDLLQPYVDGDLSRIERFCHQTLPLTVGNSAFIARTGYTGEDGFEVMTPIASGQQLWDQLLSAGVTPIGLAARDTLRLEASLHLYGQDMDDTTSPLEASLGWLVHLDRKGEFVGRSVLTQQKQDGLSKKLVFLTLDGREIARHGYSVIHDGQPVGTVTSGTKSPSLGIGVAIAYVPPQLAKIGTSVTVNIRGKHCPATVVKRPFYRP